MPTTKAKDVSVNQTRLTLAGVVSGSEWSSYMTREAAAQKLGVSLRTIDRYIESGRLNSKQGKVDGRRWANYVYGGDVDKLADFKASPFPFRTGDRQLTAPRRQPPAVEQPVASDTWTTIEAAAKRSGLPAAYLERLILRGELPARNVWEGTQASGASWRIHCADLDALRGVVQAG